MKSLAIFGLLSLLGITVDNAGNPVISDMLLYSISTAVLVGVWKCATILNDIRRDLREGSHRMDTHEKRINGLAVRMNIVDKKTEGEEE